MESFKIHTHDIIVLNIYLNLQSINTNYDSNFLLMNTLWLYINEHLRHDCKFSPPPPPPPSIRFSNTVCLVMMLTHHCAAERGQINFTFVCTKTLYTHIKPFVSAQNPLYEYTHFFECRNILYSKKTVYTHTKYVIIVTVYRRIHYDCKEINNYVFIMWPCIFEEWKLYHWASKQVIILLIY